MKHGTKPTREQKKLLTKWRLDPRVWLIERETPTETVVRHRYGNSVRVIQRVHSDD